MYAKTDITETALPRLGSVRLADEALRAVKTVTHMIRNYAQQGEPIFIFSDEGLYDYLSALAWLEKAYEDRDGNMSVLKIDQGYVPLRNEPRFQALLKRVGLAK